MNRPVLALAVVIVVLLTVVIGLRETAAQQYTIMDLGLVSEPSLAGPIWFGKWTLGINATGLVVGASPRDTGNIHAVLFSNGQVVDLGTLGGTTSLWACHGRFTSSLLTPGTDRVRDGSAWFGMVW